VQHDTIFEVVTTVLVALLLGMALRTLLFPSRMSTKARRYTALVLVGNAAIVSSFIPAVAIGVVVSLFSVIKLGRIAGGEDLRQ
jgi:hypothetical protein